MTKNERQKAYEARKGIIAKTYKLHKKTVDRFKAVCAMYGIPQCLLLETIMEMHCNELETFKDGIEEEIMKFVEDAEASNK